MARVSVIIPSRNELFLAPTVKDMLAKARGDIEVIVIMDGSWGPNMPEDDPRLKIIHFPEARGMRPGINAAAAVATGEYLLKSDGHCMWGEGYDEILKKDYAEDNWLMIPRRYALDAEKWAWDESNRKYPIDYHYLSYAYERPDDPKCGLHGTAWFERRATRKDIKVDDEMSSQGSAWFMSKKHWQKRLGGAMEIDNYGTFIQEMQELGLKTWLGGGAMKVTKNTWYAHLYKGVKYGRGYTVGPSNRGNGAAFCTDWWMNDRWPKRVRNLRWLVEHFAPVPGWPEDLDKVFAGRKALP